MVDSDRQSRCAGLEKREQGQPNRSPLVLGLLSMLTASTHRADHRAPDLGVPDSQSVDLSHHRQPCAFLRQRADFSRGWILKLGAQDSKKGQRRQNP